MIFNFSRLTDQDLVKSFEGVWGPELAWFCFVLVCLLGYGVQQRFRYICAAGHSLASFLRVWRAGTGFYKADSYSYGALKPRYLEVRCGSKSQESSLTLNSNTLCEYHSMQLGWVGLHFGSSVLHRAYRISPLHFIFC